MTTGFQSAKLVGLVAAAAVYLLITVVALVSNATEVKAANAPSGSYGYVPMGGGDTVYNWDFNSTTKSSTNVDWGVRFVFYGNAEVDYVKDRLDGDNNDPWIYPQLDATGVYKGWK